jgi:hypothetical protein
MASCQTKEYKEKLESLYNHTVPLIATDELVEKMQSDTISCVARHQVRKEEYAVSHIQAGREYVDYRCIFLKKWLRTYPARHL